MRVSGVPVVQRDRHRSDRHLIRGQFCTHLAKAGGGFRRGDADRKPGAALLIAAEIETFGVDRHVSGAHRGQARSVASRDREAPFSNRDHATARIGPRLAERLRTPATFGIAIPVAPSEGEIGQQ